MAPRKKRTKGVRKFGGKGFVETTSYPSKARANRAAKQNKKPSTKYRIVKTSKGYTVYIRLGKN